MTLSHFSAVPIPPTWDPMAAFPVVGDPDALCTSHCYNVLTTALGSTAQLQGQAAWVELSSGIFFSGSSALWMMKIRRFSLFFCCMVTC